MRKYIYTAILILTGFTMLPAQRMLPKQKGIEINAGVISTDKIGNDYFLNLAMTINGKNGNYQILAMEYSHQYHSYKNVNIPSETFSAEMGYSFYLFGDSSKTINLNTAITAVAGYEIINRGEKMLFDGAEILSNDNFLYGAGGRLSLETYLSDKIVLLIQGKVKMLWGTDLEQLRPSVGLGLRFNL